MRITVEVREDAFRTRKTAAQIEEEVRDGATMLWLARGDVGPGDARSVVAPVPQTEGIGEPIAGGPPAGGAPVPHEPLPLAIPTLYIPSHPQPAG